MANNVQREFDWGPPGDGISDSSRDHIIYAVVFLALIAVFGWVVFDLYFREASPVEAKKAVSPVHEKQVPIPAAVAVSEPVSAKAVNRFFTVQLGAFADLESAGQTLESIQKKGFQASMSVPTEEYEAYKVFLGPFSNEKDAGKVANKLNESDFPCFVIESQ
ncbi:MAG: SPOR domain-containing protein [Candidatus Riflebacteria bacterium]|nr:SPOR domain-containing protein [Candidatus Riflebacteria bacterium]